MTWACWRVEHAVHFKLMLMPLVDSTVVGNLLLLSNCLPALKVDQQWNVPVAFGINLKVICKYRRMKWKGHAVGKDNVYSVSVLYNHLGLHSELSI